MQENSKEHHNFQLEKGVHLINIKRYKEARTVLSELLEESHINYGLLLSYIALTHLGENNIQLAEECAGEAISQAPNEEMVHYSMGLVELYKARYHYAIKYFKQAIEINPNYDLYFEKLAYCNLRKKRSKRANEYATRALELNPRNEGALRLKSRIAFKNKNYSLATELLDKALSINPTFITSLHEKASQAMAREEYDIAKHAYDLLIQKKPQSEFYKDSFLHASFGNNKFYNFLVIKFLQWFDNFRTITFFDASIIFSGFIPLTLRNDSRTLFIIATLIISCLASVRFISMSLYFYAMVIHSWKIWKPGIHYYLTFINFVHLTTIIAFLAFLVYLISGYQLVFAAATYVMTYLVIKWISKSVIGPFTEVLFKLYIFGFFLFSLGFLILYNKDLISMLDCAKSLLIYVSPILTLYLFSKIEV